MTSSRLTPELLYSRLLTFGADSVRLVKRLPKTIYNIEYGAQLVRSSSSPGANYIEAIEGVSKKDFTHKLKICRKEAKESIHWLRLTKSANEEVEWVRQECDRLTKEGYELVRIFTSSIMTAERNQAIRR